jgi:hypothetical protein
LASDLSGEDFHASDLGFIIPSDASRLCSVSCLEGLSESDCKASEEVPNEEVTVERSCEVSNLRGENDIFMNENSIVDQPNVDEGEAENFNAIDRNDQDSADYSTTIHTNWYYIQIFCWILDRVIHAAYVIVCNLSKAMGTTCWKQYNSKKIGHHNFQIDLAIDLMNYIIGLDWDGKSNVRPSFMPKGSLVLVPYECNKCFFCVDGLTNRIAHWPSTKAKVTVEYKCATWVTTNKCKKIKDWVSLGLKLGKYCWMRYQKQITPELLSKERAKRCRTSVMGCPIYKEPICKECWKEGYDKHA